VPVSTSERVIHNALVNRALCLTAAFSIRASCKPWGWRKTAAEGDLGSVAALFPLFAAVLIRWNEISFFLKNLQGRDLCKTQPAPTIPRRQGGQSSGLRFRCGPIKNLTCGEGGALIPRNTQEAASLPVTEFAARQILSLAVRTRSAGLRDKWVGKPAHRDIIAP
jgi:hypothetical protein